MNILVKRACALVVSVAMVIGIIQGVMMPSYALEATKGKEMVSSGLLTSVTMQKEVNGNYVTTTEFKAKDAFKMIMRFKVPAGTYKEGDTLEMYYQLPASLKAQKKETGSVVDDHGNVFGDFVINKDTGIITVTFNGNFKLTNTYTGKINFLGKVSDTAGQDGDETIDFGKDGSKITIKKNDKGNTTPDSDKKKYDSSITKTGTLSEDRKSVIYKIHVTTNKGTGDKVELQDAISQIENLNARYDRQSFTLLKKDASGQSKTVQFADSQLAIKNGDKPSFTLSDLDALQAGESYDLTYKMSLTETGNNDGKEMLVNGIKDQHSYTDNTVNVSKKMVTKTGWVTGNTILWTVTVNGDNRNISTYKLKDAFPDGYHLTEGIKVVDKSDNSEIAKLESGKSGDQEVNVDFSKVPNDRKNHTFEISYWTNTLDPDAIGENMRVVNNVKTYDNKGHIYTTKAQVDNQPYHLDKNLTDHTVNGDQLINKWKVHLSLSGRKFDEFTYKDTIQNGVDGNGKDLGADSHYTTAKKLYDEISKSMELTQDVNGNSGRNMTWKTNTFQGGNDYNWTLVCRDQNDDEISNSDESSRVKSFELTIRPLKDSVTPTSLTFKYSTIGDISKMADKEKRTFKNKGTLENYKTDGNKKQISVPDQTKESSYTKSTLIEKQASVSGNQGSYKENLDTKYEDLNISDHKKIIYYRIIVDVKKTQSGDLTIEDTLPKGLTYKEKSLKGGFYNSQWDIQNTNYNQKGYNFNDEAYKPTITTSENDDGSTKMTITIKDGYEKSEGDDQKIAIDYCAIVSDDADWNNMKISSKDYVNKATYEHTNTSQKTTVNREVSEIGKSVTQLKDDKGKWVNQLSYNVPINPSGKDLNSHSDTLTLVDQLNIPNGVSAYLDLNSVKLCSYDWSKENKIGDEIDHSLYSFTYDEKTHKMSLEIPDAMGLVLTYKYDIDPGNVAKPSISNDVELGGRYRTNANNSFKVENVSASIETKILKIQKVDAKDYSKLLPGAVFTVSKRVTDSWQGKDYTTNKDGEIEIGDLEREVLYKVQEKTAPNGYKKNEKVYYIMLIGDGDNADLSDTYETSLYNKLDQATKDLIKGKENITFVGNQGATVLVPDAPANIIVDKSWVDQDGKSISPGAQSVHLNLYRARKVTSSVNVNVTINYDHNGSKWTENENLTIDSGTSITLRIRDANDSGTIKDERGIDHGRSYDVGPFTKDTNITVTANSWAVVCDYTRPQLRLDYKNAIIVPEYQTGIILSSKNNWSATITNLPSTDQQGNEYVYFVKEDNVDGYSTSYRNNGTGTGTIHVINTKDQTETQLPSTGGNGAGLFYVLGCVLLMVSMMYVIIKKKAIR